jgi:N utilization substance protein B
MYEEAYTSYIEGLPYDEELTEKSPPTKRDADYINHIAACTLTRLTELDGIIEDYLQDWMIDRINKADLAILRMAVYELLFEPGIPAGAAVNEAVELAKRYGADESPAFVNGVLGSVYRAYSPIAGGVAVD